MSVRAVTLASRCGLASLVLLGLLATGAARAEAPSDPNEDALSGGCGEASAHLETAPCLQVSGDANLDPQLAGLPTDKARSRLLFCRGVARLETDTTDALACFERSSQLRPHALTTLNVAISELHLERFTRARAAVERALERHAQTGELCGGGPPPAAGPAPQCPELETAERLRQFAGEQLVRLRVTLDTPGARILVGGRPLVPTRSSIPHGPEEVASFSAGLAVEGEPSLAPGPRFDLELDPGYHTFSVDRKGFAPITLQRSYRAGERGSLPLSLHQLPAVLSIEAKLCPGAIVQVNDVDVGPVPVAVRRPPGTHRVVVLKEGFEPYEANVRVGGGETVTLSAHLVEEPPPVTKTWWFWAGIGGFLASAALIYVAVKPEPSPPPYDAGSTRWLVTPPSPSP